MFNQIHRRFWAVVQRLSSPTKGIFRCVIPTGFRIKLKRFLGGTYHSIPNCIIQHKDGRKIRVGPDNIYWGIYCGRDFEPGASSVVRKLLSAGDTVVDIGANFGWYTTLFGTLVGKKGQVYAFEPVPKIFEQLSENISLNNLNECCIANRMALGDEQKTVKLNVFRDLPASHSSISDLGRTDFESFSAVMDLLDNFLARYSIGSVSFLKCDVEGAELMALKGATNLLNSPEAPLIMFECNKETSAAFGYTPDDIFTLCKNAGYTCFFKITDSGDLVAINLANSEEFDEINVIAAKEARADKCNSILIGG